MSLPNLDSLTVVNGFLIAYWTNNNPYMNIRSASLILNRDCEKKSQDPNELSKV
jgi:hypothetical protein